MIFVFGSNLRGVHGAGAAEFAHKNRGAIWGRGVGIQGQSYGIPTKDIRIITLPLDIIKRHVDDFIKFANEHEYMSFEVTRIGCGLAGYTDADIAPMFKDAPINCYLPEGWRDWKA
jgi:hypothetical protein